MTDTTSKRTYQMKANSNIVNCIISLICLSASLACGHDVMASKESRESIPDKDSIMVIKEQMLAIADTSNFFWFSDDIELQESDPHAFWLMNRMMHTVQYVRTAEDAIAWALALNENVSEYRRRIDRKILDTRAEDAAILAIENLISIYGAGNQPEMNAESYVLSILEHYKAVNEYIRMMDFPMKEPLVRLLYREYREWFEMNNAANGLMVFYTYAAAHYSALPMDINMTFAYWSEQRYGELKIEDETFWKYNREHFKSESRKVSKKRFLKLIRYFSDLTLDTIVKTNAKDWNLKRTEYAYDRLEGCFDFDNISEMARLYEEAYCNWLVAREEIALYLPKGQGKAYSETTKEMNARMYRDLSLLKGVIY